MGVGMVELAVKRASTAVVSNSDELRATVSTVISL